MWSCVDDRLDVPRPPSEDGEAAFQLRAVRREARVDDHDPAVRLEQEPVAEVGAEAHDALGGERRLRLHPEHAAEP